MFLCISDLNNSVLNKAFTKFECFVLIPVINAPITVFGIFLITSACFPRRDLDPLRTTTIRSPFLTLLELTILGSTYTLSALIMTLFFTLDERKTKVPVL